jgi:hypothetical protein
MAKSMSASAAPPPIFTVPHPPATTNPVSPVRPRYARLIYHASIASIMFRSFMTLDQLGPAEFVATQYGGWAQYLTICGVVCTGLAMGAAAMSDILPGVGVLKGLKRGWLLLAMPVETVIFCIYVSGSGGSHLPSLLVSGRGISAPRPLC